MADTVESRGTRWPRPNRRTTWVVVGLLVVGLLAAFPLAWHWWAHGTDHVPLDVRFSAH